MYHSNAAGEYAGALGKAAPPIAVTSAAVSGIPLEKWVLTATLVYTLLQLAHLAWKFARDVKRAKEERRDGTTSE